MSGNLLTTGRAAQRMYVTSPEATETAPGSLISDPTSLGLGFASVDGMLGLNSIVPFGAGDEDETLTIDLYLGRISRRSTVLREFITLDATLGDVVGLGDNLLATGERLAKAISVTKSDYATHIEAVTGKTIATFSPNVSGGVAEVVVPDILNHQVLVSVVTALTSDSANLLVSPGV